MQLDPPSKDEGVIVQYKNFLIHINKLKPSKLQHLQKILTKKGKGYNLCHHQY